MGTARNPRCPRLRTCITNFWELQKSGTTGLYRSLELTTQAANALCWMVVLQPIAQWNPFTPPSKNQPANHGWNHGFPKCLHLPPYFFPGIKDDQDFRGDANHSVKGFSQPSTHPTRPWQTLPSIACFLAKWPHLLPSTTDAGHNGKSDGAHSPPRMQVHKRGRVAIKNSQFCWIGTGNVCNSPVQSDISQYFSEVSFG